MSDMQPTDQRHNNAWNPPAVAPAVPHAHNAASPVVAPPPRAPSMHQQFAPVAHTYQAGYGGPVTDQRPASGVVIAIAWIATVLTVGYMLPWAIAATRGRSNQAAIGLIDLLLAWTLVGWIVALVMACQAHQVVHHGGAATVIVAQNFTGHTSPPAGWYPSPSGQGQRYWDGAAWTDHHAP